MSIWWAIPGFVALVGLLMLLGGVGRLFQLKLFSGVPRILTGGLALAGAAIISLAGLNLQTYARLTHEQAAAEVTLTKTGPQAFTASVRKAGKDGRYGEPETYALTGDAFRMDARILKWKPWANITGVDALYRLERIQGRFDEAAAENATPPKAYGIADAAGIDVFEIARNQGKVLNAVDAYYGGGTYVPMADGAVYEIKVTQSSLIARPKNESAALAVGAWGGVDVAPVDAGKADASRKDAPEANVTAGLAPG